MRMLFEKAGKYRRDILKFVASAIGFGGIPFAVLAYFGSGYEIMFKAFIVGTIGAAVGTGFALLLANLLMPLLPSHNPHQELIDIFS